MRVLVHDYSGHPFQVQLSRALAGRGHDVLHVHCSSYATGKGATATTSADPSTLSIEAIDLGAAFERYNMARRVRQEVAYGRAFARRAARFAPDVVLSSNDPLLAKTRAAAWCRRTRTPWVFWLQDVYSIAMSNYVSSSLGPAGSAIGAGFRRLERSLLRQAAAVVPITADFLPLLRAWGIDGAKCTVIENWAPIAELPALPRANPWAIENGLVDRRVVLYSGTLGLKHNPELLVDVAELYRDDPGVAVVVVSEGLGADRLRERKAELGLDNLRLFGYQPYERLPEVLATADVLVALLEADAGVYSVPSKILTYLCAGRALLAAMPAENLGAQIIATRGAGVVVAPTDSEGFIAAAKGLLGDPAARSEHGARARAYAEQTFDIDGIADRFERVLRAACRERSRG